MKKIILTLGVIFGLVNFSTAQTVQRPATPPPPPPSHMTMEQKAQARTNSLDHLLTLTEAQKKAIYNVNLDLVKKVDIAKQNRDRNSFQQIMTETEAQYKNILTPKQYAQYQQVMTKRPHTPPPAHHN